MDTDSVVELEPKGAETFGRSRYLKFRFRLPAQDSGQTKVVYFIIIHLEQDQASDRNRYSFPKIMKTLHFNWKALQTGTGTYQAEVGAGSGAETFKKSEPELPGNWERDEDA